ncbi:acyl-CoA reductase [Mongoliitalea lutea]|uniref:Acyl-CoA reductase n=1 Tax=Mongoliitalea lutea TaxID=849756 RepID=A0A8J3G5F5_9BACT|nr:acyl-CoA reductase [Mongoliitalea lutea]GHB36526.1 acyl-CoA reductase [Mongoliitalea lutea]
MNSLNKIEAFSALGQLIESFLNDPSFEDFAKQLQNSNNWFTPVQARFAFEEIKNNLTIDSLKKWLESYQLPENIEPKKVGILMAGNVPAVGFHDLLCVLMVGHDAYVKLSSTDSISIKWLVSELNEIAPQLAEKVHFQDMLKGMDAYIATGSDNSARYFNYYFGRFPSIIRKNRTSVAVLNGTESSEDLRKLGQDIFQYFGLGCRNISKIFVPNEEVLQSFLDGMEEYSYVKDHHKYFNNYEYNKSILLVNNEPHLDNGFLLMQKSEELVSPISMLYYQVYKNQTDLEYDLTSISDKIQIIVSKSAWFPKSLAFGQGQCPSLSDYADNIDTIKFLLSI